jgi:hypothetical protein
MRTEGGAVEDDVLTPDRVTDVLKFADVSSYQLQVATDIMHVVSVAGGPWIEIVVYRDFRAPLQAASGEVAADEAEASRNKYFSAFHSRVRLAGCER